MSTNRAVFQNGTWIAISCENLNPREEFTNMETFLGEGTPVLYFDDEEDLPPEVAENIRWCD